MWGAPKPPRPTLGSYSPPHLAWTPPPLHWGPIGGDREVEVLNMGCPQTPPTHIGVPWLPPRSP